jgi:streptogramin lyase
MTKYEGYIFAWSPARQDYRFYDGSSGLPVSMEVESLTWFAWLAQASSFMYSKAITYEARKELQDGSENWYAYRRIGGDLTRRYLGRSSELTVARLEQIAEEFGAAQKVDIFISYSRAQFYFAESLAHELHARGVGTWFDAVQLVPGTSWQQSLQEALDTCQCLVLIASRAALNSAYVREEWQTALAAHKPIYVVLFEAVRLPPELQNASIFDFRKNFDTKVAQLEQLIKRGSVHKDRVPRNTSFYLYRRLPSAVRWVIRALWSQLLTFAMLTILLLQSVTYVSLARPAALPAMMMFGLGWLALAGYTCYFAIGFAYRRQTAYTTLKIWLFAFPVLMLLVVFGPLSEQNLKTLAAFFNIFLVLVPADARSSGYPLARDLFAFFFTIFSLVICFGAGSEFTFGGSKEVLRWLATGTAPEKLRSLAQRVYMGGVSDEAVKTYQLYYSPRDERLVSQVRAILGAVKHLMPSSDEQADFHIAVLTNQISQEWLDQLVHAHPNLISIIATSIRLPSNEQVVRQLQWVDYRSGSSAPLEQLVYFLTKGKVKMGAITYPTVPENLERLVVPRQVQVMSHLLMVLAMFNLGVGGAAAITLVRQGAAHTALGTWSVISVLIAGVFFWLADRLMNRRISYATLLITLIVALASMPLLGIVQDLFHMFEGFGSLAWIGIPLGIGLLVSPLLLLWRFHSRLRGWLPKEERWRATRQRRPTLRLPPWKHHWRNIGLYVFGSLGLQAILLTHLSLVLPKPPVVVPALSTHVIKGFGVPSATKAITPTLVIDITRGPDGNLWFTEENLFGDKIGRITTSGSITEFPLPTLQNVLGGITAGPDGNLWFTELGQDAIGRITPTGNITEFRLKTGSSFKGITAGPDGNLWFTESDSNAIAIGRISTAGIITEFPLPTLQSAPGGITAGPDGNLWFTESDSDNIGRISPAGTITEFPLPTLQSAPGGITAGPDGNLWFTESRDIIGRITSTGDITEFSIPETGGSPIGITAGPDGNLWFTESDSNAIGRISTAGIITEFPLPTLQSAPGGITAGPDGNLWFTGKNATVGWIQP